MRKLSYEEVKVGFEERGWRLLSTEYTNSQTKLDVICNHGHQTTITWNNFQRGQGCRHCAGNEKFTYEQVKQYYEEQKCELLETEYLNSNTPMRYKCKCGTFSKSTYGDFRQDRRCQNCKSKKASLRNRTKDEVVSEFCKRHGCTFLSSRIKNKKLYFDYICKCGRQEKVYWTNFQRYPNCWECGNEKKSGENCYMYNPDREEIANRKRFRKKCSNLLARCMEVIGQTKTDHTHILLGYTPRQLQEHILSHPNMVNCLGKEVHVDHIWPIQAFLDHGVQDLRVINALDNLRPLAGKENLSKADKYDPEEFKKWLQEKKVVLVQQTTERLNKIIRHYQTSESEKLGIVLKSDLLTCEQFAVKKLITQCKFVFFPHEWETRSTQILSHIASYNDPNLQIVYARQCVVKEIPLDDLRDFCDLYHIQGRNKQGMKGWGLFHNEEMIGCLSLGRHHREVEGKIIVLDRLCFKSGVRVTGGSTKLFSHALKWAMEVGVEQIVSFSDNRWSLGKVYERLNFVLEAELAPDYFYVSVADICQYYSKQSQKKSNTNCPEGLTEKEWTEQRGLHRVYDAGKKRWVYRLSKPETSLPMLVLSATDKQKSRKEKGLIRSLRYYQKRIATDKVEVWCDYCQTTHTPLRLTYDKNIAKNGTYVCEAIGGSIAGKKPKKKKINPYAEQGKKQCTKCLEVKLYSEFSPNTSGDGYCSRCRACRAVIYTENYQKKKGLPSVESKPEGENHVSG